MISNSNRRHSINTYTLTHKKVLHGQRSLSGGANVEKNNPCRVRMIKLVFSAEKVESNIISKQVFLSSHQTESYYSIPDAQPFSDRSIIQQQYSKSIQISQLRLLFFMFRTCKWRSGEREFLHQLLKPHLQQTSSCLQIITKLRVCHICALF